MSILALNQQAYAEVGAMVLRVGGRNYNQGKKEKETFGVGLRSEVSV